jgi:hypothetical protein
MLQKLKFLCILTLLLSSCLPDSQPEVDVMSADVSEEEAFYADYAGPDMKFGYINTNGQLVIEDLYDGVREFSENLAATNLDGKWGYIDQLGQTVIKHEYRSAYAFKKGIARVQDFDKKYWFIDKQGKKLNSVGFDTAYDCLDNLIRVRTGQGYNFININGDTLLNDYLDGAKDFKRELSIIQREKRYGMIDKNGERVMEMEYDKIYIDDSYIRAKKDGKYFIFDTKGNKIVDTGFEKLTEFQDSFAAAKNNQQWQLITEDGQATHTFNSDTKRVEAAGESKWRVTTEKGISIVDNKGSLLTNEAYEQIFNFSEGFAVFSKNNKWGYLNTEGKEQIPAIFDLNWDFKDGRARVVTQGGIGFIDYSGNIVIRPIFFEVKDFEQGRARVQIYRG